MRRRCLHRQDRTEKNPIAFAVYVLFFPQLIVGPIVKYREMAHQLHDGKKPLHDGKAQRGAELFVFGLAKKVILADSIGALWTDIISAGGVGLAMYPPAGLAGNFGLQPAAIL